MWAFDRNIGANCLLSVSEAVIVFLRLLVGTAILSGSWRPADAALNSAQAIKGG